MKGVTYCPECGIRYLDKFATCYRGIKRLDLPYYCGTLKEVIDFEQASVAYTGRWDTP